MSDTTGITILLFIAGVYFLPWIIALGNRHRQTAAIFFLNLLLGWTLIGWVGALIWAIAKPSDPVIVHAAPVATQPQPQTLTAEEVASRMEGLTKLKDDGVLTAEEFEAKRAEVIGRLG